MVQQIDKISFAAFPLPPGCIQHRSLSLCNDSPVSLPLLAFFSSFWFFLHWDNQVLHISQVPAGQHYQQRCCTALPKIFSELRELSLVASTSKVIPGVCTYFWAKFTSPKMSAQKNAKQITDKSHITGSRWRAASLVSSLSSGLHRALVVSTNWLNFSLTGFHIAESKICEFNEIHGLELIVWLTVASGWKSSGRDAGRQHFYCLIPIVAASSFKLKWILGYNFVTLLLCHPGWSAPLAPLSLCHCSEVLLISFCFNGCRCLVHVLKL